MKTDNTIEAHPQWIESGHMLRCLTPADRECHEAMSSVIYEALPSKDWLIPMTTEEYDDTYSDANDDVVYGVWDDGRLVATSSLLHDVRAYAVNDELVDVLAHPCVEIGESMVLPEWRGRGYMLRLNQLIEDEARRQGIRYILATAHPDNMASNRSLANQGFVRVKEFVRAGLRRNLLVKLLD